MAIFGDTGPNHTPNGCAAQVVEQEAGNARFFTRLFPAAVEASDRLAATR
jgi:hypothetical protein